MRVIGLPVEVGRSYHPGRGESVTAVTSSPCQRTR